MSDGAGTDDGVGAVNARSEVLIFTRPLERAPERFQCRAPDRIRLVAAGRVVHSARYGDLVYAAVAARRPVTVSEVAEGGSVTRMSRVAELVGGA